MSLINGSSSSGSSSSLNSRLGEFFHAKSGIVKDGLIAVSAGTITGGATLYPLWAAMYPEYIAGDNIVFPSTVDGSFIRNSGGRSGDEGAAQEDATATNGLSTISSTTGVFSGVNTTLGHRLLRSDANGELVDTGGSGGLSGAVSSTLDSVTINQNATHSHAIFSSDTETRPPNVAYQLYTIADGYRG